MADRAQYTTLRFGGARAKIALFPTSSKPTEAQYETRTVPVEPEAAIVSEFKTDADRPEPIPPEVAERQAEWYRQALGVSELPPLDVSAKVEGALPARADAGDPLADSDSAPTIEDDLRGEVDHRHEDTRARAYAPPPTRTERGIYLDDGSWLDLTERLNEIDERTKLADADGGPLMEIVDTIASSAVRRERVRGAKYIGGADRETYKVLKLLYVGLSATDAAAVVRYSGTGRGATMHKLGIVIARQRPVPCLILLECEHAENMKVPPPRVVGPLGVEVTEQEIAAARRLVASFRQPPSVLDDYRDERAAARADLLAKARAGELEAYEPPRLPEREAETSDDLAAALLAGLR